MKNKLFSILLAIVMISSVCAIPIASDDGSYAAGDGTNIENGDVYGVYIDITNDSLEELIGDMVGMPMSNLTEILNAILSQRGINISTLVLDLEMGFAVKYEAPNTYKIKAMADGIAKSDATMIDTGYNYIGELPQNKDVDVFINENKKNAIAEKEVTERMVVDFSIQFGIDLEVRTDDADNIIYINGTVGRAMTIKTDSKTLEEKDGYSYLVNYTNVTELPCYIGVDMITGGTEDLVNITWFFNGGPIFFEGLGSAYGNDVIGIDEIPFDIPIDKIDDFIGEAEKIIGKDGMNMSDMLRIIDMTPIADMIKTMIIGYLPADIQESVAAMIKDIGLADIYEMIERLADDPSILERIGLEDLEGILNIFSMIDFDYIPEFIFGSDGLTLSNSEYNKIAEKAGPLSKKSVNALSDLKFNVTFYDRGLNEISTKTVEFGKAVSKDQAIINAETAPAGKYFVGWYSVYDPYGLPVDLSRIYLDVDLIPVYADIIPIEDVDNNLGYEAEDYYVVADGTTVINLPGIMDGRVHVSVSSNGVVSSIVWTFTSPTENGLNITFTSETVGNGIKVNFQHNGELPDGTYVTIDMSGKFKSGDVLNVYHQNNGKKDLVSGMAVVDENGKVTIPLAHCSSYVFELNEHLTNFNDVDDGGDSKSGPNVALFVGIGVGALAVIAIGAFIFIRMKK